MRTKIPILLALLILTSVTSSFAGSTDSTAIPDQSKTAKLVLRHIAFYCDDTTQDFTCIPFVDYYGEANQAPRINEFMEEHRNEIQEIVIENPSYIIDELNFKPLSQLHTLIIFGNDYNTDKLYSLPKGLLNSPQLKSIVFEGVRFPLYELIRLREKYTHIDFVGEIEE